MLEWMTDEIEIWSPSSSEHDEDTLIESHIEGEKLYEGQARVRPTRGPREHAIEEGVLTLRDADIMIPISEFVPEKDQDVLVTSSEDAGLEGRWFKVTDVRVFSQQGARSFSAIQTQPSRLWPH